MSEVDRKKRMVEIIHNYDENQAADAIYEKFIKLLEWVIFDITRCLLKTVEPKQGHWISSNEKDYDESLDYCFNCASKKVAEFNKKSKTKKYMVDGGWENHDSDYEAYCEECKCLLNYWPTEECAINIVEDFEAVEEITNEMSDDYLYSLNVVCGAAEDFENQGLRNRIAKICIKFLQWYSLYGKKKSASQ